MPDNLLVLTEALVQQVDLKRETVACHVAIEIGEVGVIDD